MPNKPQDILGKVGQLPKEITDITDNIAKGATKVHEMASKMDAAVGKARTYNPVSGAIKSGLSKTTGALERGAAKVEAWANGIQAKGASAATKITPIASAATSIKASAKDLENCQQVLLSASAVVDAIFNSVTGHFHPRANEQTITQFGEKWDSWARIVEDTYERLSPTNQANVLQDLAKAEFGDNVFALGSAIKNNSAGIFGGIADFEDSIHAFGGSYRNPIEAAKKIERGVKGIINATERVANSVNEMILTYQDKMGYAKTGNPILSYIGSLHNQPVIAGINKILTVGGGAATLATDGGLLKQALQSKNPKAVLQAGKKTYKDAQTIIRGLKNPDKATQVTNLATGNPTGGAAPISHDILTADDISSENASNPSYTEDNNVEEEDNRNADSYVCSGATMKCTFGDRNAKLSVYPDRTVFLTGQPMANITDHTALYNIAPFGKCHTTKYPATGAATAAAHGRLTPMPCVPGTVSNWINGKDDYFIKGAPALLKSSYCRCCYGGVITITYDGQLDTGIFNMERVPYEIQDELLKKKSKDN